jgi:hypothetical protein
MAGFSIVALSIAAFNAGCWLMYGAWSEEDRITKVPWKKVTK